MKILLVLVTGTLLCVGCKRDHAAQPAKTPTVEANYELVVADTNAVIYRINKGTGELLLIRGNKSYSVQKPLTAEELLKGQPVETNTANQVN